MHINSSLAIPVIAKTKPMKIESIENILMCFDYD